MMTALAGLRAQLVCSQPSKTIETKNHVHEIVLMTIKTELKMHWA